jgi:ATP-dependent RNA helicase RhlE
MTFDDLRLHPTLLQAVSEEGYSIPTPIQIEAIPHVMQGLDLMGCAQTGTGKTAAFALPILHRLMQTPRVAGKPAIRTLILAPTRELAAQIHDSFRVYGRHAGFRSAVIFGGVNQKPQVSALISGVDIVIATPGRLMDLMGQGFVDFRHLEQLVLDEADNMLDMGFIHDIRKIITRLPAKRQTLMFSATMPREIRELAQTILKSPVRVQVAPESAAADTVDQCVYFVEKSQKPGMLVHYLKSYSAQRVLVFSRTKHGADKIAKYLVRAGLRAEAIHGNKSQNARVRAMKNFKSVAPPVLIATDIAARGLDIDEVSHVLNYDLPNVPETYVHRIGRTGRAGATGIAVSFCDSEERAYLRDIEKLTRNRVRVEETPHQLPKAPPSASHAHSADQHTPAPEAGHRPYSPRQHQTPYSRPSGGQHASSSRPHTPRHSESHAPRPHYQNPKAGTSHAAGPRWTGPASKPHSAASHRSGPHSVGPQRTGPQSSNRPHAPKPHHASGGSPAAKPARPTGQHPIYGANRAQGSGPRQSSPASAHRHGGNNHPRNAGRKGPGNRPRFQ